MKPSWWSQVEPEANAAIESFTAKLRRKLAEPPEKLVTRKNPFLFREAPILIFAVSRGFAMEKA